MKHTNIIAFTGQQNSGKDTAASMYSHIYQTMACSTYENYISIKDYIDPTNCYYSIVSFAEPLKKIASIISNENIENFNKRELKELELNNIPGKSRRELVSFIGEQIRLKFSNDPAFWAKYLFSNNIGPLLITDLRNKYEEKEVKQREGIIIKVFNSDPITTNNGQFELSKIDADYIIDNTKSLESLYNSLCSIYKDITDEF